MKRRDMKQGRWIELHHCKDVIAKLCKKFNCEIVLEITEISTHEQSWKYVIEENKNSRQTEEG